jgi:hypothetical protein
MIDMKIIESKSGPVFEHTFAREREYIRTNVRKTSPAWNGKSPQTKGSHQVFYHVDPPELRLIRQERDGKAKPYQVMDVLKKIETAGLRRW